MKQWSQCWNLSPTIYTLIVKSSSKILRPKNKRRKKMTLVTFLRELRPRRVNPLKISSRKLWSSMTLSILWEGKSKINLYFDIFLQLFYILFIFLLGYYFIFTCIFILTISLFYLVTFNTHLRSRFQKKSKRKLLTHQIS